ncbi:STY1053 family phage-associated protein [Cupriavidus basilensis]
MPKIHVHTPFTLTKEDGTTQSFREGGHDVDSSVADHWYVKLHTGDKPVGAPAAADAADASAAINARLADLDRAEQALVEEGKRLEALAAELGEREVAVAAREEAAAGRESGTGPPGRGTCRGCAAPGGYRSQGFGHQRQGAGPHGRQGTEVR